MSAQDAAAAPTAPIRSTAGWARFLLGFAVLLGVLMGTSAPDATGRFGLAVLAAVLLTGVAVERVLYRGGVREALQRLGFGRPGGRALLAAAVTGTLVLLVYPVTGAVTGTMPALRPDWSWLLIGVFAFNGVAEELVWRGYAYRRLRAGRSFGRAVAGTMPLVALAHVPIVITSGITIGTAALAVAFITSVPLGYLFDAGRSTIWAAAILHTAIDTFKVFDVPAAAVPTFSLLLSAFSIVIPLLVLVVPRTAFRSAPAPGSGTTHPLTTTERSLT